MKMAEGPRPRKPARRPELSEKIALVRNRRAHQTLAKFLKKFPPATSDRHIAVLKQALDSKRVDFQGLRREIQYLEEMQQAQHRMSIEWIPAVRSALNAGFSGALRRQVQLITMLHEIEKIDALMDGLAAKRQAQDN